MPKISELNPLSGSVSSSNLFLYGIDTSGSENTYGKISGSNLSDSIGDTALDALTDVSASSPNDGDVLTWNATSASWISAAPTGGSSSGSSLLVATLDDLTNVSASSPNNADVLTWNATSASWVSAAPTGGSYSGSSLRASDLATRWEALTVGDVSDPELVFADGDCIYVEVPTVTSPDGYTPGELGDMLWSIVQASQLVNEIKGFPPVVNTGDLATLNLWWDGLGSTPTSASIAYVSSLSGVTENYKQALVTTASASGQGFYQRFTYADEPRIKAGRKLSTLWAIWCAGGVGVTLSLKNSDNTETSASKVTSAQWTIVEVPNHTLAGTYVDIRLVTDAGGTFYSVPLGANIGERGFPLRPRQRRKVNTSGNFVDGIDPGGAWVDVDCTSALSPLACVVSLYCLYINSTSDYKDLGIRRNGDTSDANQSGVVRVSTHGSNHITGRGTVDLDDENIFEYGTTDVAGDSELVYIWYNSYEEWE